MRRSILALLVVSAFSISICGQQSNEVTQAQASLVETERDFAKYSVAKGQPEAWLEFFADDGVIFQPGPVNSKETMRQFLPTPSPAPNTLNWEPIYGDISRSGDLGYNIGPWRIDDHTPEKVPTAYGYFFSVWKKQPDQRWKVVVDFGIRVPSPTADHELGHKFLPASQFWSRTPASVDLVGERKRLIVMDQELAQTSRSADLLSAYLDRTHATAKVLRTGASPSGKDALASFLSGKGRSLVLAPLRSDISRAGDMGYTYGSYELREGDQLKESGYYSHMWKRDESGSWKIVVCNFRPKPPAAKP